MKKYFGDYSWLVYVLPGFLALFVASFISDFPRIRDSQLPIVYVALTTLSVFIPLGIWHFFGKLTGYSFTFDRLLRSAFFLSTVFLNSVVLGGAFGFAHNSDWVSNSLRSVFGKDTILVASHTELIKVLFRESYSDAFLRWDGQPHTNYESSNRYARIFIKDAPDGVAFEGVVTAYHGGSDNPQVWLSPACKMQGEVASAIAGPGVWLDIQNATEVRFLYDICSPCSLKLDELAGVTPPDICPLR